jgi:hypothetical protein
MFVPLALNSNIFNLLKEIRPGSFGRIPVACRLPFGIVDEGGLHGSRGQTEAFPFSQRLC